MTVRHQDENILDWLRQVSKRLDRLEKGDKGVRVNDTRLGDTILTPNHYTNQMEMRNLKSGNMQPLGFREIVFSWPGDLILGDNNDSPPECMPETTIANEIVLSRPDTTGCACVAVNFPGFTITTIIEDGAQTRVRPIHVALNTNDLVYVTLVGVSGSPVNLSAAIRFGQPSELADNDTVEGCGYA